MTSTFDDPNAVWRECERSWATWLTQQRYTVTDLGTATGNSPRTSAPMVTTAETQVRAPDLQTVRNGVTEFWEVKFRRRADVDPETGAREHWMSRASFLDYLRAAKAAGCELWVVLYEAPTATTPGRWLRANVRRLRDTGHRSTRVGRSGQEVEAWVWPVATMEVVEGPPVRLGASRVPLLTPEGPEPELDDEVLDLAQRGRRRRRVEPQQDRPEEQSPASVALDNSNALSLSVLCRRLGLGVEPRYSVTRVGPLLGSTDDLLDLLDHGIRVFVVTDVPLETGMEPGRLNAFRAARLLEDAVVPGLGQVGWAVDGRAHAGVDVKSALQQADRLGGLNVGQWEIVHAAADSNVRVSAGAGTGKTETMSERLVFLLSTSDEVVDDDGSRRVQALTADQVALVTFTREAAREMRSRLARSLMLRQRLCALCVPPVRAWMMQLGNARVSTIHAFSKSLVRDHGGAIGFGPGFRVGQRLLEFRAVLQRCVSDDLVALGSGEFAGMQVPPAYAWRNHLESVWQALENNGTPLMALAGQGGKDLDWGTPLGEGLDREVHDTTRRALEAAAPEFALLCRQEQVVPTSQLVALAHAAVNAAPAGAGRTSIRHLFVDEFQDTDGLQIDLLLDVHERLGPWMFVVGDIKQGIYRFRGAAGNAFNELDAQMTERGLPAFSPFSLSRNFRSGATLLSSLTPYFDAWNAAGLLVHGSDDRLRPVEADADESRPVELRDAAWGHDLQAAADQVGRWREAAPDEAIALLCRQNHQAHKVQELVQAGGGVCDVLVGGDFFRTPAVREMRVLLETLVNPSDEAALLELCETRWGSALASAPAHPDLPDEPARRWAGDQVDVVGWADRVAALNSGGRFRREDLRFLEERLRLLASFTQRVSALSLLVDLIAWLAPDETSTRRDDLSQRRRYRRCLDHLVTLLDAAFTDRPASLRALLEWLRLQIATNRSEDEPVDLALAQGKGTTLALTVHKAKGLEFDRVVVPVTTNRFSPGSARVGTDARVVTGPGALPRLLWQWRPARDGHAFANFLEGSDVAREDAEETAREETRLLYVAMTRARRELVLMRPSRRGATADPATWAELLLMGGGA